MQRFRLSQHWQCESRRIPPRRGEHQRSDLERGRPYHRGGQGTRLHDLPRERPLRGHDRQHLEHRRDSRPNATLDKNHPATGDCNGCHSTTPTFAADQTGTAKPTNHIPTNAPCAQCHTTAGNNALYSVTGTHQGVSNCLSCHGPPPAGGWANITIVGTASTNHMPIGNLDCNGSGCHTTAKVTAGGFRLGAASISAPTLNVAGHSTVRGQVPACTTCHESAPYVGMIASTSSTAGDSRPDATLDKNHPATGDCDGCHSTTPTFAADQTGTAKPANHIPTNAPCTQCHTTAGNNSLYSVTGTHQGVSNCLSCHGPPAAGGGQTSRSRHGQHQSHADRDPRLQRLGLPHDRQRHGRRLPPRRGEHQRPDLERRRAHDSAAAVPACTTCHETAPYVGMIASTAAVPADSRPTAYDKCTRPPATARAVTRRRPHSQMT